MKFIVCGGRDYKDTEDVFWALDALHAKVGITLIIEGGALGTDRLGRAWAIDRGIPYKTYEADWKTYGKRAGPFRNLAMLTEGKPDGVVAFPGGRGTADMVNQATKAGIKVWKPYG
jgi:hypothetical protein